ncbi:MAG: Gfo/Idh/MocA family protein [Candidatus Bathyarchaeia archaeon]
MLNVGVIGVGVIGKAHLQAYLAQRNVKVVAICDIDERELKATADKFKIENCFVDYNDLLSLEEIDAVSVCTPPFNHSSITCDAAAAETHVLCEKPMAVDANEAKKMVEACREAGVKLGICTARIRFDPAVEMAKRYISEGKLGKIYYVRVSSYRRRGRPGIDILVNSKWFLDSSKAGGGALIDIGCYDVDMMLYLLDNPQPHAVSAFTFKGIEDPPKIRTEFDVEEHASVLVRFTTGQVAMFETAWASNLESHWNAMILGSKGGLRLNPFTYYARRKGEQIALTVDLSKKKATTSRMHLLIKDFVSACSRDRIPKTPAEEGLNVMEIITAAYESARLGKEVVLYPV